MRQHDHRFQCKPRERRELLVLNGEVFQSELADHIMTFDEFKREWEKTHREAEKAAADFADRQAARSR